MQISCFDYYPDKWPSWPLAWQIWLLSLSAMLLLGHWHCRKWCWKLLSCLLNSHKMQNKPMPVSDKRHPTAPWVKPLPFPLDPNYPCVVSPVSEGLQTKSWVLDGFWRMLFAQQQGKKLGAIFLTNYCRVSYHFGNFLSHASEWVAQLLLSCVQWQGKIHS